VSNLLMLERASGSCNDTSSFIRTPLSMDFGALLGVRPWPPNRLEKDALLRRNQKASDKSLRNADTPPVQWRRFRAT
jgi:hypothetical protein